MRSFLKVVSLLAIGLAALAPLQAQSVSLRQFSVGDGSGPQAITRGSDGALWVGAGPESEGPPRILRVTTTGVTTAFPIEGMDFDPGDMVLGSDGNVWFTTGVEFSEGFDAYIGKITPTGTITLYNLEGLEADALTAGPDGAVWFTDSNDARIGRISITGVITSFRVFDQDPGSEFPNDLVTGPDGAIWFTGFSSSLEDIYIGRMTTAGVFTRFILPNDFGFPSRITAGADGALWFSDSQIPQLGRITTAGVVTAISTEDSYVSDLTSGPDGAIWFTSPSQSSSSSGFSIAGARVSGRVRRAARVLPATAKRATVAPRRALAVDAIGRISGGVLRLYPLQSDFTLPSRITPGPDNAVWFTQYYTSQVSRIAVVPPLTTPTGCPVYSPGTFSSSGVAFSAQFATTGGLPPLTWSFNGSLPPGITLNATTGLLSGTTASTGSFSFTVSVTDTAQPIQSASAPCTLIFAYPPQISAAPTSLSFVYELNSGLAPDAQFLSVAPLTGSSASFTAVASVTTPLSGTWLTVSPTTSIAPSRLNVTANPQGLGVGTYSGRVILSSGSQYPPVQVPVSLSVVVYSPVSIINSCPLFTNETGTPVSAALDAIGGNGRYVFSITGNLPAGLSLVGDKIQGTITSAPGTYPFTIGVTSGTQSATKPCSIIITPSSNLHLTGSCPARVVVGESISFSASATGGTAPYTFSLSGPSWLKLTSSGANTTATGIPTESGTVSATITVRDNGQSTPAMFPCSLAVQPAAALKISGACPADPVIAGSSISIALTATGGLQPYTWSLQAIAGLSLSGTTGAAVNVTGTAPATTGSHVISVTLTDSAGTPAATYNCTLTVQIGALQISGACPAATLSLPVSITIPLSAIGGRPPYQWTYSGPSWLTLSSASGTNTSLVTSGQPTTSGPFTFTVTLRDVAGTSTTFQCNSSINAAPIPPATLIITTVPPTLLQPIPASVQLATPTPFGLTGVVQLRFVPNAFGLTDNPQVIFEGRDATPQGRLYNFVIPAGQTTAVLPPVQQGTVAGTIRLEVIDLHEGTRNVLGTAPILEVVVPRQVPIISGVNFENETASGFDIVISGFSTPRDMVTATLTFSARADATIDGASFTVQLNNLFAQFYGSAASQTTGSLFTGLRIPISLQGDKNAIGSVAVALANSVGTSTVLTKGR